MEIMIHSLSIGIVFECDRKRSEPSQGMLKGPEGSNLPLLRVKYGKQYQSHQLIVHNATW